MSNSTVNSAGSNPVSATIAGGQQTTVASRASTDLNSWFGVADKKGLLISVNPSADLRSMTPTQLADRVLSHL